MRKGGHDVLPLHALVVFEETFPSLHGLVYSGSLHRVCVPAPLEELVHWDGEADFLGILREYWPVPFMYPADDSSVIMFLVERDPPCEDFHGQHCKSKDVGRSRFQYFLRFGGVFGNFRSEPPYVPNIPFGIWNLDIPVDRGEPVVRQSGLARSIDDDIGLRAKIDWL